MAFFLGKVNLGRLKMMLKRQPSLSAGVFHDTFTSLRVVPEVLYPSLNVAQFDRKVPEPEKSGSDLTSDDDPFVFLSINRYERKKNLPLALKAFRKSNFISFVLSVNLRMEKSFFKYNCQSF